MAGVGRSSLVACFLRSAFFFLFGIFFGFFMDFLV
jgi:hypothetical protein